jgi:hypothetical protein
MPDPITMNPNNQGTLTLGTAPGTDYGCQVTDMQILPVQNTTARPGTYCSPPTNVPGKSTWTMRFGYLQDWTDPAGLSQFLLANDATLQPFTFTPDIEDAPVVTGNVWVTAGAYGGLPAESWVFTGTWSIEGVPTFTPPVVLAAAGAKSAKSSE